MEQVVKFTRINALGFLDVFEGVTFHVLLNSALAALIRLREFGLDLLFRWSGPAAGITPFWREQLLNLSVHGSSC